MAEIRRRWSPEQKKVAFAASLGSVIAWYDFYLYGALASVLAQQFFTNLNDGQALVFALLAFAAGFIVRPFGGLVFGRLGDLIGRKHPFLITMLVMGLSTFTVGLLPSYASVGVAAPLLLMLLRLLQGLALGGEYGGAVTMMAEHAPPKERGLYTAWIQATATVGLMFSLIITEATRYFLGAAAFAQWGWRLPFLLSAGLLVVSVYVRFRMPETPVYLRMKAQRQGSRGPVAEALGRPSSVRRVLLALFGLTAGQAVVWYTAQVYVLFFLSQTLQVDSARVNWMVAAALLLGTPFFWVFGALSDFVGRKPVVMAGCGLAALLLIPLFSGLTQAVNPALDRAQSAQSVVLTADPADCSLQFRLLEGGHWLQSCDLVKQALSAASVSYTTRAAAPGALATVAIGDAVIQGYTARGLSREAARAQSAQFRAALDRSLVCAGYPAHADSAQIDMARAIALLTAMVILVAMVYAPIAAMLAEMFPTRIRYTAINLPYHMGNGWFGGLLPAASFAIVAQTGDMYSGLWYPVCVAAITALVGMYGLRETLGADLDSPACGDQS